MEGMLSNRYELGDILGYGGMSEVRMAVDTVLQREVAIKILRPDLARDPSFLERFRMEAQNSAKLNHPNIVAIYDTAEAKTDEGVRPYIVMELIRGQTLRDMVHEDGALYPQRAMHIVADLCNALEYSHQMGVIHRDVKPGNIMITNTGKVKVMDFGIARVMDAPSTMTTTSQVIGTASYLSPEQARGQNVDVRSDIYAAGCVLYEAITGQPPFEGDSALSVAYQHVQEDPIPPSHLNELVSIGLDAVVLKALAKDPADRYQSAADMEADLVTVLHGQRPMAMKSDATLVQPVLTDDDIARMDAERKGKKASADATDKNSDTAADNSGASDNTDDDAANGTADAAGAAAASIGEMMAAAAAAGQANSRQASEDAKSLTADQRAPINEKGVRFGTMRDAEDLPGLQNTASDNTGDGTGSTAGAGTDTSVGDGSGALAGVATEALTTADGDSATNENDGTTTDSTATDNTATDNAAADGTPADGTSTDGTAADGKGKPAKKWWKKKSDTTKGKAKDSSKDTAKADAEKNLSPKEAKRKRVGSHFKKIGIALLIILGLTMTGIVITEAVTGVSLFSNQLAVPDVTNMKANAAADRLRQQGLRVELKTESSNTVPRGMAIRTDPAASTMVARGGRVTLIISSGKGKNPIVVPDVRGLSEDEAREKLTMAGLKVASDVRRVPSESSMEDKVVGLSVPAGSPISPSQEITLLIGTGETTATYIPSVNGMSEDKARSTLEEAGFTVEEKYVHSKEARGTVIGTNPSGKAKEGDTVTLLISDGSKITMPDVRGLSQDEAVNRLHAAGWDGTITVKKVGTKSISKAGQVKDQNPSPGSDMDSDQDITLQVYDLKIL